MFVGYTVAFLCIAVCMIGILFYTWFFPPSTHVINYVTLSDFQALFYRGVLFVEVNKFYYELAIILLCEKAFLK